MKYILIFLAFCSLYSYTILDVKNMYENGQFDKICTDGVRNLVINANSDGLTDLYAKSCLKMDKINELVIPIVLLYKNKAARENAAYYSTLLYEKKMLYMALNDGVDISYIRLPETNYVLSKVFDRFVKKEYKVFDGRYIFDVNPNLEYQLFLKTEDGISKMVLLVIKNSKLQFIKTYW